MIVEKTLKAALCGAVLATAAAAPVSAAEQTVEVGVLNCSAVPGTRMNLIVRSTVDVECVFVHDGKETKYRGETGIAFGLDLSFRKDEQFAFTVISTNEKYDPSSIAGKYVGAKASATVGVGLGAAALVGGSDKSFGLNPLALEANQGFGISGGIGFLYIELAK